MDQPRKCPACQKIATEDAVQCDTCLVIFSKWKDPKQRQAEKRLSELSLESSKGFPKSILIALLALIGLPLAIYTLPDLETRLLGGKLRYHLQKGQSYTQKGVLHTIVTQGLEGNSIDETETTLQTTLHVRESDSGGNVTLSQTFDQLRLKSRWDDKLIREKEDVELQSWNSDCVMSPLGTIITTMANVADQMKQTVKTQKHLSDVRRNSFEEKEKRTMELTMEAEAPLPPKEKNPYDVLMESLSPGNLEALTLLNKLKFPSRRLHKGDRVQHTLTLAIGTKMGMITQPLTLEMTVREFKRTNDGFFCLLEWNTPFDPVFPVNGVAGFGSTKGEAWLNYNTGIVDQLEGTIDVTFNSKPPQHVLSHQQITRL